MEIILKIPEFVIKNKNKTFPESNYENYLKNIRVYN